jgi:hypothetical protein
MGRHATNLEHFCTRSSEMIQQAEQKKQARANNPGVQPSAQPLFRIPEAKVCRGGDLDASVGRL